MKITLLTNHSDYFKSLLKCPIGWLIIERQVNSTCINTAIFMTRTNQEGKKMAEGQNLRLPQATTHNT